MLAWRRPINRPATLWEVFGEAGHPVRTTVSDMGPLLLTRLLALNETQAGVLKLVFKIADDEGLLLDLKDLRAMLQFVGDKASRFTTEYGNVSAASIRASQRGLLQIEQHGGDHFFGDPMLNIAVFMQTIEMPLPLSRLRRRPPKEAHLYPGACRSCLSNCPRCAI